MDFSGVLIVKNGLSTFLHYPGHPKTSEVGSSL